MRLGSLVRKEIVEILRQREFLFLLLAAPLLETIFLGYVIAVDIRRVPVEIVNLSAGPAARRIADRVEANPSFRIVRRSSSPADPLDILREGRSKAVITLRDRIPAPSGAGELPETQIVLDGSEIMAALYSASVFRDILFEAAREALPPEARAPGLDVKTRVRFNPGLKNIDSLGPGLVGLLLTVLTVLIGASTLVREREQQTIDTLRLSRLTPFQVLLGKGAPAVLAGVIGLILGLPLLMIWFRVPFRGNAGALALAALLYLVAVTALSLLISAAASTHAQSMLLSWYVIMIILLLSGFFTPAESIPAGPVPARAIAAVNPFRFLMQVVRGVMLKGNGVADACRDLAALAGLGLGYSGLAWLAFRRVFRRSGRRDAFLQSFPSLRGGRRGR